MLNGADTFNLSATTQLLLTVCLVTLLWGLHARLQKFAFFRWWAWAWTAFAAYLFTATISFRMGPAWTFTKAGMILALLVLGFLQPMLLILGGLNWRAAKPFSRSEVWKGLALSVAVAVVFFLLSFTEREYPLVSFAVRNAPRTFLLACALLFCFVVFWREFRASGSYAAAITGVFCLGYAVNQALYCLSFAEMLETSWHFQFPELLHRLANLEYFDHSRLLLLDLVETCGICLGMILLLVERYQHTMAELELSERERLGLAVNNASLQTEINNRQRIEAELRRSEAKFAAAFRASPHAMMVISLRDGRFLDVNASFERQSGYARDEIVGKTVLEIGIWLDSENFAAIIAESLKRKTVDACEARLRAKCGRIVHMLYSVEVIEIEGEPCALVVGEDVTERLQIERALRESEAKFRLVAETVTSAIWLLQENHFIYFNKEFENITGYAREEILAMDPWDLVDPECRAEDFARVQAKMAGEPVSSRCQLTIITKQGEKRWLDFASALTEFNGKPALLASALDVTAKKRAEQELKEHVTYMDALVSNLPLGIVIKDDKQRVRFCNPAFEQMFHYTQTELQGRNLDDVIAPHDKELATQLSEAVQSGEVVHTIARRRRKDGTFVEVELYGVKVYSENSFVGAFAIYQDITERRKSEEKLVTMRSRLVRAQEEERARIARDLHDDAGQRLALLSIDLERLKQASVKIRSSLTQQLEALVKAASEITSDVHNVSRRLHPSQVELLGLGTALSNFCKDFAAHNAMKIQFENRGLRQKPPQEAALCMFRVAQEAIRNVQKHSGTRTAMVQLDEVAGSMRLTISDEGEGFDPDSAEFTQGLGLLSMQERLHSLGGELFIHSRRGGGTCIEACIPQRASVGSGR
jgi:PAS domain S-box-containing protein